jgi:hypothetical protein
MPLLQSNNLEKFVACLELLLVLIVELQFTKLCKSGARGNGSRSRQGSGQLISVWFICLFFA